jgi:hypothetical protein
MQMRRMPLERFLSYILDNRKAEFSETAEVYYHNPKDARGKPSSFVFVVLLVSPGYMYCAGTKCDPYNDTFDLEKGLKEACNRVWREYRDMPSLYGKDHGPKRQAAPSPIYKLMGAMLRESLMCGKGVAKINWHPELVPHKKLLAKPNGKEATI